MTDPHRPLYHFTPAKNWMNDPIPFFWDGVHHIFFQHNPEAPGWGNMHWGHAVSRDLVHWEELPIALVPTPGGPDREGVWTGSVVEHDKTFYAFYTGQPGQVQCLATSRDLIHWEKHPGNPIIARRPDGYGDCFRDPQVWREQDAWFMVIGSEQPDHKGGAALLYRSENLNEWQYQHPLLLGDVRQTDFEFECPDFFPLGGKSVFLSSQNNTWWQTGTYDSGRFTPEHIAPADGDKFYAAKTLHDRRGRRLLFGWLREGRSDDEMRTAGWAGVLSLPRQLTLQRDGTLGFAPPSELNALRGRHQHFEALTVADGLHVLDGVQGDVLEVLVQFEPTDTAGIGLSVRCAPDGADGVELLYDPRTQRFGNVPLALDRRDGLALHVYIDRSVIESFANGRACQARRTYPTRPDCLHIALCARGGTVRVKSVDVWEMKPLCPA
ncbi:MAG: glycoside hydrolase family 32 protein [Armatimonadetes bacterium]|nr:glycoside hydrolase family 32 protein [Armatimonadota bacterium]